MVDGIFSIFLAMFKPFTQCVYFYFDSLKKDRLAI